MMIQPDTSPKRPQDHSGNLKMLTETISRLYYKQANSSLQKIIAKILPVDLAQILESFPEETATKIFLLIQQPQTAAAVLRELSFPFQENVLQDAPLEKIIPVLEKMAPDKRTDLIDQLDSDLASRLLSALTKQSQDDVQTLLQYQPNTAGGLMTSQFFALSEKTTVSQAIESVRNLSSYEMVFYLYVVDDQGRLTGVSSLRQLILAKPDKTLAEMMNPRVVKVKTDAPQEDVAHIASRYRLLAVPVVDEAGVLVGLVTVDDVIGVIQDEITEEMLKMAGTDKSEILASSSFNIFKIRFPWLVAAFAGGLGASAVLDSFETTLSSVVQLSFFLPIIMGMAGNVGTQAATVAVRGLATGAIRVDNFVSLLIKEIGVGFFLGSVYGAGLAGYAWLVFHNINLMWTVGISIMLNILCAAVIASSLPIFFQKIGSDPALAAGPFVLTSVDVLGVVNYLIIASLIFGV